MNLRRIIEIKDKIATYESPEPIVCGNANYVIDFVFDEEWTEHDIKTAIFIVNGQATEQVFSGTECPVPVIQNTLIAWVGVFAGTINDGTLSTSTPALVKCVPCVTDVNTVPAPPSNDVYNQIIELIESGKIKGDDGKSAYDIWLEQGNTGSEAEFLKSLKGEGISIKANKESCTEIGDTYIDITTGHLMILTDLPDVFTDAGKFQGTDGEDGNDGVTPHIGANGNWFIGEEIGRASCRERVCCAV